MAAARGDLDAVASSLEAKPGGRRTGEGSSLWMEERAVWCFGGGGKINGGKGGTYKDRLECMAVRLGACRAQDPGPVVDHR